MGKTICFRKYSEMVVAAFIALLFCHNTNAADPNTPLPTPDQQKQMDALELQTALVIKETALVNAQTALRKAKVGEDTPTTGNNVTPLSGAVNGAETLTFAMYVASIDSLKSVAQQICADFKANKIATVYITTRNVPEAAAKDVALQEYREQLVQRLISAKTRADQTTNMIKRKEATTISTESIPAVASGIDIASGLMRGVAGIASFFKTERTIKSQDNLLGANEIAGALTMCQQTPNPPPIIIDADGDIDTLVSQVGLIKKESNDISENMARLGIALDALVDARAPLDQEIAAATKDKDQKKLDALKKQLPPSVATFQEEASKLYEAAQKYLDAIYLVDKETGLSPLIVSAQLRALHERAKDPESNHLVLALLKSSGYSLTTKRLLFNDKVSYAGGVALRVSIIQKDGTAKYDRILFNQSGWIPANFDDMKAATLPKNNF
ncbi:hypothetical protein MTYP_03284 [Methylophilaceae bacterium]|nr:hypothetical protein MTYP_03284 [Methylophilaceae bacterium]